METIVCHPPGTCSLAVGAQSPGAGASPVTFVFTGGSDGRVLGRSVKTDAGNRLSVTKECDWVWEAEPNGPGAVSAIWSLALSPCCSFLVVADDASQVSLVSVSTRETLAVLCRTPVPANYVAFGGAGEYVIVCGREPATVRLVYLDEGPRIDILRPSEEDPAYDEVVQYSVIDLAVDPLGCYFATVHEVPSGQGRATSTARTPAAMANVCLWSVDAQRVIGFGVGRIRHACCARFSPDGQILAVGDRTGRVHFLERDSWENAGYPVFDVQVWARAQCPAGSHVDKPISISTLAWDARSTTRLVVTAKLQEDNGDTIILYDLADAASRQLGVAEAEIRALACCPVSSVTYYLDLLGQLGVVTLPAERGTISSRGSERLSTSLLDNGTVDAHCGHHQSREGTHTGEASTRNAETPGSTTKLVRGTSLQVQTSNSLTFKEAASRPSQGGSTPSDDDSERVSSVSQREPAGETDDDDDDDGNDDSDVGDTTLSSRKRRRFATGLSHGRSSCCCDRTCQQPFQIGSTLDLGAKRRILQWNLTGCLTSLPAGSAVATSEEPARQIELEFSDVSKRSIRFPDRYGFQYGTLNAYGILLGAQSGQGGSDRPALIYYRPHESWSLQSDWIRFLPPQEDPIALCMSKFWVAVATSAQSVHLYSFTGLITDSFHPGLNGSILTMVASENLLCILSRSHGPDGAGEYMLLRIHQNGYVSECLARGNLPICPAVRARPRAKRLQHLETSRLVWVGLTDTKRDTSSEAADSTSDASEDCALWIYFASGHLFTLRAWTFGCYRSATWNWTHGCHPLSSLQRGSMHLTWHLALTSERTRQALAEADGEEIFDPDRQWFYPLGVKNRVLHGIILPADATSPLPYPRSQLRQVPLERFPWPLAQDSQYSELEQAYLRTVASIRATRSALFDAIAFSRTTTVDGTQYQHSEHEVLEALAQKARELQRQADKTLLYLIEEACEKQRDRRVLDLASRLSSAAAFKVAVQIANRLKRAILAEKITQFAQIRIEELESSESVVEQLLAAAHADAQANIASERAPSFLAQPSGNDDARRSRSTSDPEEAATGTESHPKRPAIDADAAPSADAPARPEETSSNTAVAAGGPSVRAAAALARKSAHLSARVAERLLQFTQSSPAEKGASRTASSRSLHSLAAWSSNST